MAGVAHIGGDRMRSVFTHRSGAVVTVTALIGGLVMGKRYDYRHPHIAGMTGFAHVAGQRVCPRLEGARTDAIVTTGAGTRLPCYGGMIKGHAQPGGGVMADVALLRRGDVGRAFARGDAAVMARVAGGRGLRMVNGQGKREPARTGGMAGLTLIRRQRVGGRLIGGVSAGMTSGAAVGGLCVIKRRDQG